jgi:hypothetical protein
MQYAIAIRFLKRMPARIESDGDRCGCDDGNRVGQLSGQSKYPTSRRNVACRVECNPLPACMDAGIGSTDLSRGVGMGIHCLDGASQFASDGPRMGLLSHARKLATIVGQFQ